MDNNGKEDFEQGLKEILTSSPLPATGTKTVENPKPAEAVYINSPEKTNKFPKWLEVFVRVISAFAAAAFLIWFAFNISLRQGV